METKKTASKDSNPSGSEKQEETKKPDLPLKPPAGDLGGLWPDWLHYGHGVFLLLLLLTLLLGYGLPYEKPQLPQRDYRAEYKSVEEETAAATEYERKKEVYDREKKAWDEGGEESRRGWIGAGRNLAKFSVVLWLAYCLITHGLMPLVRAIPKHFGKDLSVTLMPVLILGMFYALATLILNWIPVSGWPNPNPLELNDQSLWKVLGQFIVHLTHPLANMVVTLKEFAVDKWFVPLLFVAATLVIGWGKVRTDKADVS
ncbi:MAG: hypothetical protein QF406_13045 [Verrucomicrobiota bacterium]|nr:hypothetical protein [Verrucomicrobiota bacterium]